MRSLPAAMCLAIAVAASGCGPSHCQELGEKLCACTGETKDTCKTQVEEQLKTNKPSESECEGILGKCNAPPNADFCEWLLTCDGQKACGIAAKDTTCSTSP